jgi:hypothetical protein
MGNMKKIKVIGYVLLTYFNNDTTDAGEIGSSQTITALYEVILTEVQNTE